MKASQETITRLIEVTKAKPSGSGYIGRCINHADKKPSFSFSLAEDGNLLTHCFAGCNSSDINRRLEELKLGGASCKSTARPKIEKNKSTHDAVAYDAKLFISTLEFSPSKGYIKRKLAEAIEVLSYQDSSGDIEVFSIVDIEGNIFGYQKINESGEKNFLTGQRIKGCFHPIGDFKSAKQVYIVEGVATGMSVHRATNTPVICALNAGNIEAVISEFKNTYPDMKIIIAADNDHKKENNVGKNTALGISKKYNVEYCYPETSDDRIKDYNDLHTIEGLDAVRQSLDKTQNDFISGWGPVIELKSPKRYGPALDIEILPESIKEFVLNTSKSLGVTPEMIACPLLSAFASVAGRAVSVKPFRHQDWQITPKLWSLIIADSGSKKTPCLNETIGLLGEIEKKLNANFSARKREWDENYKREMAVAKALKDKGSKIIRGGDGKNANVNQKDDAKKLEQGSQYIQQSIDIEKKVFEEKPRETRLLVNDCTTEKLLELLRENSVGLLLIRDEIVGWIDSFDKKGRESDRSLYLEAWNGDGYFKQDRITRESVIVDGFRLTVVGGTQPQVFKRLFDGRGGHGLSDDGLLQRFQLTVVPEPVYSEIKDEPINLRSQDAILKKLTNLSDAAQLISRTRKDLRSERDIVSFDSEAHKHFISWSNNLGKKIYECRDHLVKSYLNKVNSLVPELALVFHLIDLDLDPDRFQTKLNSSEISKATLEKAIKFSEFLRKHMEVMLELPYIRTESELSILDKIKSGEIKDGATAREIYRKGWSGLNSKEQVWDTLNSLEICNYIRIECVQSPNGGKPKQIIRINPLLLTDKTDNKCG